MNDARDPQINAEGDERRIIGLTRLFNFFGFGSLVTLSPQLAAFTVIPNEVRDLA